MSDDIEKQLAGIEAMFVQVARDFTKDGDRVTFRGLSPATLFFSDRPQRVVGHLSAQQFVDEWDKGENSFAEDPPNGVISFLEAGDEAPEDAIVVLKDPSLDGDRITYTVEMLEGSLPDSGKACSVFIDPFGRPLSPVSLAGMNRRARRRGF
ncbi:MAG TPA: hypothetical protein VMH50_09755 [Thermoleophilia bacterium]|nr:hypothetical protein [Thermoleophilia bacterium]